MFVVVCSGGVSEGSVKRSSLESAMRVGLKPQHTGPIKKGGRLRDTVAKAVHNITLAVRVRQRHVTARLPGRCLIGRLEVIGGQSALSCCTLSGWEGCILPCA